MQADDIKMLPVRFTKSIPNLISLSFHLIASPESPPSNFSALRSLTSASSY